MSLIGIIANPRAGKDIRRLVAEADGMDNRQKANIVRRVLLGIAAVGIDEVALMPDSYGIGPQALDGLSLPFRVTSLDIPFTGRQDDTLRAAEQLHERDAGCIVVLGGDGTHRMAAKACGEVPLLPISAGTNNVWPQPTEGTLAGLAAGLVANKSIPAELATRPTQRLEVIRDAGKSRVQSPESRAGGQRLEIIRAGAETVRNNQTTAPGGWGRSEAQPPASSAGGSLRSTPATRKPQHDSTLVDIALVDVVVYDGRFTGSKAVWETDRIHSVIVTSVEPGTMGLSSIAAAFPKPPDADGAGLVLRIGPGGGSVLAPIAPGLIRRVPVQEHQWLRPGDSVTLTDSPCVLALDGEREIVVTERERLSVRLTWDGPRMIDVPAVLQIAAQRGHFVDGDLAERTTFSNQPVVPVL